MNDTLLNLLRKLRLSGLAETLEVRFHDPSCALRLWQLNLNEGYGRLN